MSYVVWKPRFTLSDQFFQHALVTMPLIPTRSCCLSVKRRLCLIELSFATNKPAIISYIFWTLFNCLTASLSHYWPLRTLYVFLEHSTLTARKTDAPGRVKIEKGILSHNSLFFLGLKANFCFRTIYQSNCYFNSALILSPQKKLLGHK